MSSTRQFFSTLLGLVQLLLLADSKKPLDSLNSLSPPSTMFSKYPYQELWSPVPKTRFGVLQLLPVPEWHVNEWSVRETKHIAQTQRPASPLPPLSLPASAEGNTDLWWNVKHFSILHLGLAIMKPSRIISGETRTKATDTSTSYFQIQEQQKHSCWSWPVWGFCL